MMTQPREKIAGLVLAAGRSSRMGKTKQLLRIGGKTVLERIVEAALGSNLHEVVLVLGYQAGVLRGVLSPMLSHARLRIVENIHYEEGMSTSIRVGLGAVEDHAENVMILLADMPHVNSHLINHLLAGYLASGKTLGAVSVKGRRSLPVILGRAWYRALHDLQGDVGARALFAAFTDEVCLVDAPPTYDDLDLDTPEDYRKALLEIPA